MAFTDLGSLGSGQTKTAGTTVSFTITQALNVGDVVTVQLAADNTSTTTGATSTHTSVVCGSNTFTKVSEQTNGQGAAAAGVTLSLWRCVITSAVASGTTLTGTIASTAAKCISARRFTVAAGSTLSYSAAQVNTATGAPASLTVSGLTSTLNHLAQRASALESTSTSISTQTTGWTLGADIGTSGGSSATNISTRSEYLTTTGVTSINSAPGGTSGDGVSIMFVISETPPAPSWTSSTTASVAENATLSYTMVATNADSYSIVGGADQAKFEISGTTLRWASNGTKNYEAPDDADANNTYVVTLRATNGGGTADQTVTVTVTNVAEITLAALTWGSGGSVAENSANTTAVGTVAGRTSGSTLSLFDDAGGRFAINSSTGAVTVANGTLLDYETNTSHNITVRETIADATNSPRDTVLTVTITNVSPSITSSSTASVAENSALAHSLTVASGSPTWSIVGGADQSKFEISGSTLRWASNGTKNYEAPDDADTNNVYVVTVRATVSGETADQTVSVTVTDVAEGGAFVPSSLFGVGDVGYAWNPTDSSKIWQNSGGTGAVAVGDPIGRATDISGLNNHLLQSGAGVRPLLQNVGNGMMKFDGSDDVLVATPCLWAAGEGTVIMAIKGPTQDGKFFWGETNSAAGGAVWAPGLRSNVNQDVLFYWRGDNFTPIAVNKDINLFDDTLKVYAIVDNGSTVTFYINGTSVATHNYTSRATLTGGEATTINQAHLGNAMVGGLPYDVSTSAYIGAGIVIDRALNSTELANAVNWISTQHGLTSYVYKGALNRAAVYKGAQAAPAPYVGAKTGLFAS